MRDMKKLYNNESGFVLVASLLILVILVIIGVAATNTSTIELQIAGNEKVHKQTFYQADGGAELGSRLTFENAMCINSEGFAEDSLGAGVKTIGEIQVEDLSFAAPAGTGSPPDPSDSVRDASFPNDDTQPHTNLSIAGNTQATAGSGLQMVAGYEGMGKGSAAGGTHVLYEIFSQHIGVNNSESVVALQWRLSGHLINSASSDDCNFD